MIDRLTAHLDRTMPVTDAPTQRALGLALADLENDRDALAALIAASGPAG